MKNILRSAAIEVGTVLVAAGLDLLGEPPATWHPVVWYGKLIRFLEHRAPDKEPARFVYGGLMLVLAAPAALLPAAGIRWLTAYAGRYHRQSGAAAAMLLVGAALKPCFALNMLVTAGRSVRMALEREDLPAAREALQSLVSRDRSQLSAELAAAAAVESLAENVSDSVVAPLFYYALAGLPGAALYRLYNTFDAMIGYHGAYEYLGKAAARWDDLLNLLPARLTALLIIALAPVYGGNRRRAWRVWRRDARQTESPNAGHPMSAAAGALGVQLEKTGHYVLGDREAVVSAHTIKQAEDMVWLVGGMALLLTIAARLVRSQWYGSSR